MEEKALTTLRTMLGYRHLPTETQHIVIENEKKMERVTAYTIGAVFVCFSQKDKVLANDIETIVAYANNNNFKAGVIIVAMSPPSENVLRVVKSHAKNRVQFWHISQLQFDITTHRMAMPHRILGDEEKGQVLERYKISDAANQLPWIDSQDAMAKWIGAIPGDVIEVVRHSDSAGRSFYYRYCVEDVNVAQ